MEMPKLEINETAPLAGTNTQITKVPGGWIYQFYYSVYTPVGARCEDYRMQAVFVPEQQGATQ